MATSASNSQPGCGRAWRLGAGFSASNNIRSTWTLSALQDAVDGVVSSGSAVRNERFKHAGWLN